MKSKRAVFILLIIVVICFFTTYIFTGCDKGIKQDMLNETTVQDPGMQTPGYSHTDRLEWWLDSDTAFEMWSATEGALIIDVRSEESFTERHVAGAINVLADDIISFAGENIPHKDTLIITYCFCGGMGGPALSVRNLLAGAGYTNVFYTDPEDEWEYTGTGINAGNTGTGRIITGAEAREIINSDETAIMLDVRNPDEYESGHVEGAVLIPVAELDARLDELPDKNSVIIVYCAGGIRSARAVEILTDNGYLNVYDMQMFANWQG